MEKRACNTEMLTEIMRNSRRKDFNRTITADGLRELDPHGIHLISFLLLHEHARGIVVDPHYRCLALLKLSGQEEPWEAIVDITPKDFKRMPLLSDVLVESRRS